MEECSRIRTFTGVEVPSSLWLKALILTRKLVDSQVDRPITVCAGHRDIGISDNALSEI